MVNLSKGQAIDLRKPETNQELNEFYVGAGWDPEARGSSRSIDIDVHVYLKQNGVTKDHLYYAHKSAPGVSYSGDNVTGDGDGIDENMKVTLSKINSNIDEVELGINMFTSGVSFAEVSNAFAAVYEDPRNYMGGLAKFNLTEQYDSSILSVIVGRLKKDPTTGKWSFVADGTGFRNKLGSKSPYESGSSTSSTGSSSNHGGGGFFSRLFGGH